MASFASSSSDPTPLYPGTKLIIRTKESGIRAYYGPPSEPSRELNVLDGIDLKIDSSYVSMHTPNGASEPIVQTSSPCFSPNGQLGAVLFPSGKIEITVASTGAAMTELSTDPTTMNMDFSPKGTFLVTWSRPIKTESGINNNLKIWNISNGSCVCAYAQKQYKKDLLQWTEDETVCCRLVSNEVHILNGQSPEQGIIAKVYHKGISSYKVCPVSRKPYVCVFSPSSGGRPGQLALYRYETATTTVVGTAAAEDSSEGKGVPSATSICNRGVMTATEATLLWSPTGVAVLAHTQSDVDSSNYYGASGLSILSCKGCEDGSFDKDLIDPLNASVAQGKDGHIHDVQWSPMGDKFVISAGAMPCVCTLHNPKGESIYNFGTAHRNTISWSPHGRFLVLAGFGNLVGDMDFYDTQAKKMKKMSTNNSHCAVTHAWSPDSRYFMTATLAPRMNVDNGFKIFRYDGRGPIFTENLNHCYDAMWIPTPAAVYPNRARSPSRTVDGEEADSNAVAAKPAATAPVAAYRPRGSTGFLSEALKRPAPQAGKVVNGKVTATTAASAPSNSTPAKYVAPQRKIPGMAENGTAPGVVGGKKKVLPPPARR